MAQGRRETLKSIFARVETHYGRIERAVWPMSPQVFSAADTNFPIHCHMRKVQGDISGN